MLGKAADEKPFETMELRLIRWYPVRKDETEMQAKRRKVEEENSKKSSNTSPVM